MSAADDNGRRVAYYEAAMRDAIHTLGEGFPRRAARLPPPPGAEALRARARDAAAEDERAGRRILPAVR